MSQQSIWGPQQDYLRHGYKFGAGQLREGRQWYNENMPQISDSVIPAARNMVQNLGEFSNEALLGRQIGDLRTNMSQAFNEDVLPAIQGNSILGGALGGGRQGVAEGIAGRGWAQGFGEGVTNLMGQSLEQRLQANALMPTALQSLFGLSMAPLEAMWTPFRNYTNVIGRPVPLTESFNLSRAQSQSEDWASSFGKSSSFNFGLSLG